MRFWNRVFHLNIYILAFPFLLPSSPSPPRKKEEQRVAVGENRPFPSLLARSLLPLRRLTIVWTSVVSCLYSPHQRIINLSLPSIRKMAKVFYQGTMNRRNREITIDTVTEVRLAAWVKCVSVRSHLAIDTKIDGAQRDTHTHTHTQTGGGGGGTQGIAHKRQLKQTVHFVLLTWNRCVNVASSLELGRKENNNVFVSAKLLLLSLLFEISKSFRNPPPFQTNLLDKVETRSVHRTEEMQRLR